MKKLFFYISIIILCILVWLNTKNKESIENPNALIGLSVENLYNIYKTKYFIYIFICQNLVVNLVVNLVL